MPSALARLVGTLAGRQLQPFVAPSYSVEPIHGMLCENYQFRLAAATAPTNYHCFPTGCCRLLCQAPLLPPYWPPFIKVMSVVKPLMNIMLIIMLTLICPTSHHQPPCWPLPLPCQTPCVHFQKKRSTLIEMVW